MKFKFYLKKSHFGWKLTVRSNLALNKAYYIDHISVLVLNTMMESTLEHTAQQLLLETLYKANRGSHEWGDDQMVQFGYSRIRALRMKIHPEYVITISAYIKCIIHVGVTVSSSWWNLSWRVKWGKTDGGRLRRFDRRAESKNHSTMTRIRKVIFFLMGF